MGACNKVTNICSINTSIKIISRSVFAQAHESFIKDGGTDSDFLKLENLVHFKTKLGKHV